MKIIPAILAYSRSDFVKTYRRLSKLSKKIHIDVMDGKFVSQKNQLFKAKNASYHLMVREPTKYSVKGTVLFHVETKNVDKSIAFFKKKGCKVGLVLKPETSVSKVKPYLSSVDEVLILTVHPGRQGSPFIRSCVKKIGQLRKIFCGTISVDGGMNENTVKFVKNADVIYVGSALVKAANPARIFARLLS